MTSDLARPPRHPGAGSTRRLELLDLLRGFALFGVPLFNLRSSSLLEFIVTSIALLALLFGLGFAMQAVRPGEKPNPHTPARSTHAAGVCRPPAATVRLLKVALVVGLATTAPLMLWDSGGAGVRVMRLLHQIALSLFCMAAFVAAVPADPLAALVAQARAHGVHGADELARAGTARAGPARRPRAELRLLVGHRRAAGDAQLLVAGALVVPAGRPAERGPPLRQQPLRAEP